MPPPAERSGLHEAVRGIGPFVVLGLSVLLAGLTISALFRLLMR